MKRCWEESCLFSQLARLSKVVYDIQVKPCQKEMTCLTCSDISHCLFQLNVLQDVDVANYAVIHALRFSLCMLIAAVWLQKGESTWPGWSKECLQDWWPFIKLAIPSKLLNLDLAVSRDVSA